MRFREGESQETFIIGAIFVFLMISVVTSSAPAAAAPSSDNVAVEVKLEKELRLTTGNSTSVPENETVSQLFECVIPGLSKDVLLQFATGDITYNYMVVPSKTEDGIGLGSRSRPYNVTFSVANGTLILKGKILGKKNLKGGEGKNGGDTGSKDGPPICDVLIVDIGNETKAIGPGGAIDGNIPRKTSKALEIEVPLVEALDSYSNEDDSLEDSFTATSREALYRYGHDGDAYNHYHHPPTYQYAPVSCGDYYNDRHNTNNDLQKMVSLITERLLLGERVAVYKWDRNLPVQDIYREKAVLEDVVRHARNRGLDSQWAYRFFQDQIEANKDLQYELLNKWQYEGRRPLGPPVNLEQDVRPEIDYINRKLIELASFSQRERWRCKCRSEIETGVRYSVYTYNLENMHQKALHRATSNLCVGRPRDLPEHRYPYHRHPPPPMNPQQRPYDRIWYARRVQV